MSKERGGGGVLGVERKVGAPMVQKAEEAAGSQSRKGRGDKQQDGEGRTAAERGTANSRGGGEGGEDLKIGPTHSEGAGDRDGDGVRAWRVADRQEEVSCPHSRLVTPSEGAQREGGGCGNGGGGGGVSVGAGVGVGMGMGVDFVKYR